MIQKFYFYFEYASLIIALVYYSKYKGYSFYKFFVVYLINIVLFSLIAQIFFKENNHDLFNIYTFIEFNLMVLIYYHLINYKIHLKFIKILAITFNTIYFSSFFFLELINATVIIESVVNSIFIILFFKELLNSEKILNYKKLLPFWVSVGFLIYYLTSVPYFLFAYFYSNTIKIDFPLLKSLIIVFHLCFIFGLITCKKTDR
jgi:hypothetical protein